MAPHKEPSFFCQSIDITNIHLPENKSRGSRLHRSTKMIETETETETVLKYPRWNLERRPSSGQLFWQNIASPRSKVSFRFDVEVLEFEKDPAEDIVHEEACSVSSTIAICVTCMAAVVVSVILPWYLMNST